MEFAKKSENSLAFQHSSARPGSQIFDNLISTKPGLTGPVEARIIKLKTYFYV